MDKLIKCKNYCKDLSYDYKYDDYGHIISNDFDTPFKCLRYNKILGLNPIRCKECINDYNILKKKV